MTTPNFWTNLTKVLRHLSVIRFQLRSASSTKGCLSSRSRWTKTSCLTSMSSSNPRLENESDSAVACSISQDCCSISQDCSVSSQSDLRQFQSEAPDSDQVPDAGAPQAAGCSGSLADPGRHAPCGCSPGWRGGGRGAGAARADCSWDGWELHCPLDGLVSQAAAAPRGCPLDALESQAAPSECFLEFQPDQLDCVSFALDCCDQSFHEGRLAGLMGGAFAVDPAMSDQYLCAWPRSTLAPVSLARTRASASWRRSSSRLSFSWSP